MGLKNIVKKAATTFGKSKVGKTRRPGTATTTRRGSAEADLAKSAARVVKKKI